MSAPATAERWAERLVPYVKRASNPRPLAVEGRLVRMVGLTLEAAGCQAAVGDRSPMCGDYRDFDGSGTTRRAGSRVETDGAIRIPRASVRLWLRSPHEADISNTPRWPAGRCRAPTPDDREE